MNKTDSIKSESLNIMGIFDKCTCEKLVKKYNPYYDVDQCIICKKVIY